MDLNRMTVAARPRTPWEGLDLGFAMARKWFLPLWSLWWLTALPLNLVLALWLQQGVWLPMLLAWWLKPLYEPPLLFWLSRALFGERLAPGQVARQWLRVVRPRLLANLTWARLGPNRSFYMPVALLERLRGKPRGDRIRVLGRRQQAGFWLTVAGIHFETVLELSFVLLLLILLPREQDWLTLKDLLLGESTLSQWLQYAGSLLAMSLIAPFYVAGGFAFYLTRRMELEAWDIEIAFRRMGGRRPATAPRNLAAAWLLALGAALAMLPPQPAGAAQTRLTPERARQVIQEVLADDDFGRHETESYWKYVAQPGDDKDNGELLEALLDFIRGFFKGFARVGEFLMWTALALLLAYLTYRIAEGRNWLQWRPERRGGGKAPAAVELFGLDLRPLSLPADPVAAALALLGEGRQRDALSLLYRCTLGRLVNELQLEVPAGATEGDCLRLVNDRRPQPEAAFFSRLTRAWSRLAYAHVTPDGGDVEALCEEWRRIYAGEGGRP